MRETNRLLLAAGFVLALANCIHDPAPIRVSLDGHTLIAENSRRRVLKEVGAEAEVQGYGLLAEDVLFVAWSSETQGGASTFLSLFELRAAKEHFLCEIGGTGETEFAVNERSGLVAFNWRGAVYITRARDLLAVRDRTIDCAALERRFVKVLGCASCYEVRWVTATRLSYRDFGSGGVVTEVDLSRLVGSKP